MAQPVDPRRLPTAQATLRDGLIRISADRPSLSLRANIDALQTFGSAIMVGPGYGAKCYDPFACAGRRSYARH